MKKDICSISEKMQEKLNQNRVEVELIEGILKRLNGKSTNIYDNSYQAFLYVGDKVKVYINKDLDIISGIVKYDISEDKYYIRINRSISDLNNGNRNLYLDPSTSNKICSCEYSDILERLNDKVQTDYNDCIQLLENHKYEKFYKKLLDLFYDDRLYLEKNELDFIKEKIRNNEKITIEVEFNIKILCSDDEEFENNSEYLREKLKKIDILINDDKKIKCNEFQINIDPKDKYQRCEFI